MKRLIQLSITAIFVLSINIIWAQSFMVQGVLRDPAGRTVENGTHSVTFKLYDAESGGTELWSETHGSVTTEHGVFSAKLGTSTSLSDISFADPVWLGITVDDGNEISPRMELVNSPASNAVSGASNVFPSTGNVGIGTKDPQFLLGLSSSSPWLGFTNSGGGSVWSLGNAGTGGFQLAEDGTPRVTVTAGGYVGILTTDPKEPLHVSGTSYFEDRLRLMRTGGPNYLDIYNGQNFIIRNIGLDDSGQHDAITVTPDGNVGVGTVPTERLDVSGNMKLTDGGALIFSDGSSLSTAQLSGSASSVSTPGNALITADADEAGSGQVQFKTGTSTDMVITNTGLVGIGTTSPTTKFQVQDETTGGYLQVEPIDGALELASGNDGHSYIDFKGNANLGADYMGRIGFEDGIGFGINGGNVGINNNAPDAKLSLDVDGDGDAFNVHSSNPIDAKIFQVVQLGSDGYAKVNDANGNTNVQLSGYTGAPSYFLSNVGIGTTTPGSLLELSSAEPYVRFTDTDGGSVWNLGNYGTARFILYEDANGITSERLVVKEGGNVGVGTSDPIAKFQVQDETTGGYLQVEPIDGALELASGNDGHSYIDFKGNANLGADYMGRIGFEDGIGFGINGGNVGINNNAPDAKLSLDVDGDGDAFNVHTSHSTDAKIFQVVQSGNDGYAKVNDANGNTNVQLSGYTGAPSYFLSNVGIGTDIPNTDLDIENATGDPHLRLGRNNGTYWDHAVSGADSWYWQLDYNGSLKFEMHGDGSGWMQGGLSQNSDRRLKRNIRTLDSALDKITRLRGVEYQWRRDEFPDRQFDNKHHIGFVAQEIESVFPELVTEGSDGYKSVNYNGITPVLVEAVKEQQTQIENLKTENQALQETIRQIQTQLNQLMSDAGAGTH